MDRQISQHRVPSDSIPNRQRSRSLRSSPGVLSAWADRDDAKHLCPAQWLGGILGLDARLPGLVAGVRYGEAVPLAHRIAK